MEEQISSPVFARSRLCVLLFLSTCIHCVITIPYRVRPFAVPSVRTRHRLNWFLNTDNSLDSPQTGLYGPPPKRYAELLDQTRNRISQFPFTAGRLARILRQNYGTQRLDFFNCHICREGRLGNVDCSLDSNTPGRNGDKTCSPSNASCLCPGNWSWNVEYSKVP